MSLAKKLKMIVKGEPKPTFGTDPNDPWSARAGITESESGFLSSYLKSRGINPEFVSRDTKISHAKSSEFSKWKRDHRFDDPADTVSSVTRDKMKSQREELEIEEGKTLQHTPVELRQHALNREKHMTKVLHHNGLHKEEALDKKTPSVEELTKKYNVSKEEVEKELEKGIKVEMEHSSDKKVAREIALDHLGEKLDYYKKLNKFVEETKNKVKPTALERFRAASAEREKKHADIETQMKARHAAGKEDMKGSIDRLEKQLNKEESEQIDELKKSTVFSWLKQQPVVPEKKPGMSRKDHNQKIKSHSKGWNRALDRLSGYKPTSEDVYQDPQAATQTAFDMGTTADQTEPTYSRKKEMSKSARMIKSLYKHNNMKEELYDHEKEDKSVVTYGKKPKAEKVQVDGDENNQAAMVLKGGKTLTGQTRDTLEIDPVMRKPSSSEIKSNNTKTDK